ncbi:MAG: hypothetical protein DRI36_02845, partial [Caldiserica bacterium]
MKLIEKLKKEKKDIPHLCSEDFLSPYTSCWLCIVEIEGEKRPLPSCWYEYKKNLKFKYNTDELNRIRKEILSLYLSNHFADCIAPCKEACPSRIDIQGYIRLIREGKYLEAYELIRKRCPIPRVIGRVCPRFCEKECYRNLIDEPLRINDLKRFVSDMIAPTYIPKTVPLKKPRIRVAVIGSGPAGVSCAYYLRRNGIEVDIYEKEEKAGGLLYYAIPDFRLDKEIVLDEVELILKEEIRIFYKKEWGRDFSIEDLFEKGYRAIFIAIGSPKSKLVMEGGIGSLEFLRDYNLGRIEKIEGNVI